MAVRQTARWLGALVSMACSCSPGFPGAMINFMALVWIEDQPGKDMLETRDELLDTLGYGRPDICEQVFDEQARTMQGLFTIEGGDHEPEPAAVLYRVSAVGDGLVVAIWEVHPNAWRVMRKTLLASAASLELRAAAP